MAAHGESNQWVALGERARRIETVWQAAAARPIEAVPTVGIRERDEDCWFDGETATVRAVVEHARRINEADLSLLVILAADGQVLDGMHRIAKAVLTGRTTVPTQRLSLDPEPDWLRAGEP